MKKLFIISAIVLLCFGIAYAEIIFYNSNQSTVAWNAVTTDTDGDVITGVTYKLWLANADTDPDKASPVEAVDGDGDTSNTEAIITLGTKGRFFAGCQAVLGDQVSDINWADEIENQENTPLWGLRFAVPPHAPKNLHK